MGFGCTSSADLTNGGYTLTGVTTSSGVFPINVSGATYSDPQVGTDGFVTVESTNGRMPLFQVAICTFPNNEGLIKTTGNLFEMSNDSGNAVIGQPGQNGAGKVNNNHLEMSNVDLAREFVDLIVAQRSFQANSRVISSSADMLQEVINIIR
jgi:flagellar hook protein FlgE